MPLRPCRLGDNRAIELLNRISTYLSIRSRGERALHLYSFQELQRRAVLQLQMTPYQPRCSDREESRVLRGLFEVCGASQRRPRTALQFGIVKQPQFGCLRGVGGEDPFLFVLV